ncbi:MAG: TonB-dependent receptor [Woeseiaceae bacterium]
MRFTFNPLINKFILGTATMAAALTAAPAALAQGDGLEEIVVTAQRREQSLQEVPMAISAFTDEDLAALQADNLDSLQGAVPNLNLVRGRGSNSSVNIFIRGVGQPDALQTFDPAVGVYLDDVYMARIQGALFKLYGMERIEVLRGPQGTLYGKNTPGGAIRLISKRPGDEFEGSVGLLAGDYGRMQVKGYAAGPVSDNLSLGVSVLADKRDGYVDDPATGQKYNDEDTTVGRISGVWNASDTWTFDFALDMTREDVGLTVGRAEDAIIGVDLITGVVLRQLAPVGEWNFQTRTSLNDGEGQKVRSSGGHITATWDANDNVQFKSITASRSLDTDFYIDIDATEWELGDVFVGLDQKQFSQEFQLLGNNGDNVNWIMGLYYLHEEVPSDQIAFADDFLLLGGTPISFTRTIVDDLDTKSYGVFAQIDYGFGDWNLGLGGRYTREDKSYFRSTSTFSDILGNADPAFEFSDSNDWSDFTPTVTLDYTVNDGVRLYGRVAKGFKSGGFNGRANGAADVSSFDPETVWTAELGAKTVVFDGKLQANYAIFQSTYEDFQARVSVADGIDFRFPVLNAAELDITGAEIEAVLAVTDSFQLAAQIGYLDSEYGKGGFAGSDGIADEPAFSPEFTGRIAASYTASLASGASLTFGVDGSYRDAMWLSVENVVPLSEDDYTLLNALVSFTSPEGHWNLSAGIKNATDEVYKVEGQEFRSVGNIQTAYYGTPRMYTVAVDYHF